MADSAAPFTVNSDDLKDSKLQRLNRLFTLAWSQMTIRGGPVTQTIPLAKITAGGEDGEIRINSTGSVVSFTAPT